MMTMAVPRRHSSGRIRPSIKALQRRPRMRGYIRKMSPRRWSGSIHQVRCLPTIYLPRCSQDQRGLTSIRLDPHCCSSAVIGRRLAVAWRAMRMNEAHGLTCAFSFRRPRLRVSGEMPERSSAGELAVHHHSRPGRLFHRVLGHLASIGHDQASLRTTNFQ